MNGSGWRPAALKHVAAFGKLKKKRKKKQISFTSTTNLVGKKKKRTKKKCKHSNCAREESLDTQQISQSRFFCSSGCVHVSLASTAVLPSAGRVWRPSVMASRAPLNIFSTPLRVASPPTACWLICPLRSFCGESSAKLLHLLRPSSRFTFTSKIKTPNNFPHKCNFCHHHE